MKYLAPLILLIFVCVNAFLSLSQENAGKYMPRDYTIIPPSPEVSALMKYTEIPVSYFNGLPQIDLPIYEVKEGKLSVPISLNYHGGGIKVNEVEGEVGLGWTLLAGGCISRTVYGYPDDMKKHIVGDFSIRGRFNATENDNNLRNYIINQTVEYDPGDYRGVKDRMTNILKWNANYEEGLSDMANDVFQINCMGITGTFIYNDAQNIVLSSSSAISISPTTTVAWNKLPYEYIITDGLGTKYYFSRPEYTRHEFSRGSPGLMQTADSIRYISAWHLTKIKNIENDSIIFHYKTKGYKRVDYGGTQTQYFSSNEDFKKYIQSSVSSSGLVHYYPEALTTIESSSALVRFEYNSTNDYITGLYVEMNDDMRKVIKRYKFDHDFFGGSKRLMLKSVRDISLKNNDMNNTDLSGITLYDFGYFRDGNLPFKNSDQDFCGYYNAKGNNGCLVPKTSNVFMQTCGANRDVGFPAACYGSLTSIKYPTGGKTIFEWEPNSYSYLGNSPITKKSSTSETIIETETLCYLNPQKKAD